MRALEEVRRRVVFAMHELELGNYESATKEIDGAADELRALNADLRDGGPVRDAA